MIVDRINEYLSSENLTVDEYIRYDVEKLAGWSFKRQFMDNSQRDSTGKIWLSSIGKCARQIAYGYHGFPKEGRAIDGRARITFWMGDLVETAVISLAKLAGVQLFGVGLNQTKIFIDVNGFKAEGHPDGFVLSDAQINGLEVKSMPDYGFARFEKGQIDESYIWQDQAYMMATNLNRWCMVAIDKNTGVLGERIIQMDDGITLAIMIKIERILKSTTKNLPEPVHTINYKGQYPWQWLPMATPCRKECFSAVFQGLSGKISPYRCS